VVAVRDWKLAPGELWAMTLREWFWLKGGYAAADGWTMTEADYEDCRAVLRGDE
jgi:hypothetical protein